MNKFWKGLGITMSILALGIFGILLLNNSNFQEEKKSLNQAIAQKDSIIEITKLKNDSLKVELNKFGWTADLMMMCIGFENDTIQYPTIKLYNSDEREIGKFLYKSAKKIHLGDKFLLVSTPK